VTACGLLPEKPTEIYQLEAMRHWQKQHSWSFDGRLALSDEKNSLSVSIAWKHQLDSDEIELTGPLAQGRVLVTIYVDKVEVDDGDKKQTYYGVSDAILTAQLGVDIPFNALRYWVLGINDPQQAYVELNEGFMQNAWQLQYKALQAVQGGWLPKRLSADKDKTKVKLVIDEWVL
jgi:outer membrane lipoprotein LolB